MQGSGGGLDDTKTDDEAEGQTGTEGAMVTTEKDTTHESGKREVSPIHIPMTYGMTYDMTCCVLDQGHPPKAQCCFKELKQCKENAKVCLSYPTTQPSFILTGCCLIHSSRCRSRSAKVVTSIISTTSALLRMQATMRMLWTSDLGQALGFVSPA